jgi:hypothetical protein
MHVHAKFQVQMLYVVHGLRQMLLYIILMMRPHLRQCSNTILLMLCVLKIAHVQFVLTCNCVT